MTLSYINNNSKKVFILYENLQILLHTVNILLLSERGALLSNNFRFRVLIGILSIASSSNLSHISGVPVKHNLCFISKGELIIMHLII